jgi:hypothetical protein
VEKTAVGAVSRPRAGAFRMKKTEATDILARHVLSALPDSVAARRQLLSAVLTVCPASRYAGRISLMLEHLEQHATISSKFQLQCAQRAPETYDE